MSWEVPPVIRYLLEGRVEFTSVEPQFPVATRVTWKVYVDSRGVSWS